MCLHIVEVPYVTSENPLHLATGVARRWFYWQINRLSRQGTHVCVTRISANWWHDLCPMAETYWL